MFDGLVQSVPAARIAILHEQVSMLRRTVERTFGDSQDGALAICADLQGEVEGIAGKQRLGYRPVRNSWPCGSMKRRGPAWR